MTTDDFTAAERRLLAMLQGADRADALVTGILEGFPADEAAQLLSPEHFADLAALAQDVAPGPGWYHAAAASDEAGRLNRELLLRYELARPAAAGDHDDESPEAELLARYELASWVYRWHPGTGESWRPFADTLLRVELGALAWRAAPLLGSTGPAAEWLEGAGGEILALPGRIQAWTGWRRTLADHVLPVACEAYLATWPAAPDAERVRALGEAFARQDAVLASVTVPDAPPTMALIAGHAAEGEVLARGVSAVDPALVPPRSVHPAETNVAWEVRDGDVLQLVVTVGVGDVPVAALAASVLVDGRERTLDLPRTELGYQGVLGLSGEPRSLVVHVHAPGESGPFRDADAVARARHDIDAVLSARHDVYDGVESDDGLLRFSPDAPLLAEVVCWRPEL